MPKIYNRQDYLHVLGLLAALNVATGLKVDGCSTHSSE